MKKVVRIIWISLLSGLALLVACVGIKNCSSSKFEILYGPPEVDIDEQQQLDSIQNILQRREGACIYGSPEVRKQHLNETLPLNKEASKIQKQLEDLDKE